MSWGSLTERLRVASKDQSLAMGENPHLLPERQRVVFSLSGARLCVSSLLYHAIQPGFELCNVKEIAGSLVTEPECLRKRPRVLRDPVLEPGAYLSLVLAR